MDHHTESHFTKTSNIPNANMDTIPNTIKCIVAFLNLPITAQYTKSQSQKAPRKQPHNQPQPPL